MYTVKNVKSFQGREGYGFECSLYRDGKRIGTVTETASGGMVDFYLDKGEEKILDDFCKTLPKWGSEFGDREYDTDKDIFITNLVNKWEEQKRLKKLCKNKTAFTIDCMKKGECYTINTPYNSITKANLEKEYKGKGLVILNEELVKEN